MSPHRRALVFLVFVTACERPSPAGPASGGDQPAAETNPAAFDVATREPGSPLPFLTLNQRALFERGRGVFEPRSPRRRGSAPSLTTMRAVSATRIPSRAASARRGGSLRRRSQPPGAADLARI